MHESQFVLGMQVQIIDLLYFRSNVRQGPMSTKLYSIASNYIYTIILLMDSVLHRTSVAHICGRYRPSSGPIALRHVLNCPP